MCERDKVQRFAVKNSTIVTMIDPPQQAYIQHLLFPVSLLDDKVPFPLLDLLPLPECIKSSLPFFISLSLLSQLSLSSFFKGNNLSLSLSLLATGNTPNISSWSHKSASIQQQKQNDDDYSRGKTRKGRKYTNIDPKIILYKVVL